MATDLEQRALSSIAGIAAIIFWLIWSRMPSFGPPLAPESRARRSIMEHVNAAGHFAWRNHSERDLVASSVEAVMHEAERRHPGISRLSPEDQSRRIAKLTELPASAVFEAVAVRHEAGRPRIHPINEKTAVQ